MVFQSILFGVFVLLAAATPVLIFGPARQQSWIEDNNDTVVDMTMDSTAQEDPTVEIASLLESLSLAEVPSLENLSLAEVPSLENLSLAEVPSLAVETLELPAILNTARQFRQTSQRTCRSQPRRSRCVKKPVFALSQTVDVEIEMEDAEIEITIPEVVKDLPKPVKQELKGCLKTGTRPSLKVKWDAATYPPLKSILKAPTDQKQDRRTSHSRFVVWDNSTYSGPLQTLQVLPGMPTDWEGKHTYRFETRHSSKI